jgi:predicted nucleotidyltransferase component of viral defense system
MRSEAIRITRAEIDPAARLNLLREYLQAQILRSLHESEAFLTLSFVGGTALRFGYSIARFSEDLDFSVENPESYAPRDWLSKLARDLRRAGYDATVSWNDRKTVHTGWVRFSELLQASDLASVPTQKISIKLEIDSSPPAGAGTRRVVVQPHAMVALRIHDLPSLMAGKIHSVVTRPFTKGRDWYDLLWYLSQTPPVAPNETLLANALEQTAPARTSARWPDLVRDALSSADLDAARRDVAPFLEHPEEADWITVEHLSNLLDGSAGEG